MYGILLAGAMAFMLLDAVRILPSEPSGLTGVVDSQMANSGVEHPVTAVLLNFRGYDTWLELGVLLLAVMGVLLFQPADSTRSESSSQRFSADSSSASNSRSCAVRWPIPT